MGDMSHTFSIFSRDSRPRGIMEPADDFDALRFIESYERMKKEGLGRTRNINAVD
jgi:hypothetical protein